MFVLLNDEMMKVRVSLETLSVSYFLKITSFTTLDRNSPSS